jgi:hypothetical protein
MLTGTTKEWYNKILSIITTKLPNVEVNVDSLIKFAIFLWPPDMHQIWQAGTSIEGRYCSCGGFKYER